MSRRQIVFVVATLASMVVTACGVSATAPRHDDTTTIVVNSGGGLQR